MSGNQGFEIDDDTFSLVSGILKTIFKNYSPKILNDIKEVHLRNNKKRIEISFEKKNTTIEIVFYNRKTNVIKSWKISESLVELAANSDSMKLFCQRELG